MKKTIQSKIVDAALGTVDSIVENSFLMLLFDSCNIISHSYWDLKNEWSNGIIESYNFIKNIVINIEESIEDTAYNKESLLMECFKIKQKILEASDCIYNYHTQMDIIESNYDKYYLYNETKKKSDKNLNQSGEKTSQKNNSDISDINEYIVKCKSYITSDIIENSFDLRVGDILYLIPVVFSDNELLSYVKNGILQNRSFDYKGQVISLINCLKQELASDLIQNYGEYHTEYVEKISELKNTDLNKLRRKEEFKQYSEKLSVVFEEITDIEDFLYILYSNINFISILISSMFDFDDITTKETDYLELYNQTVEYIKNNANIDDNSELIQKLETYVNRNINTLSQHYDRQQLIYNNVNFEKFSENAKTVMSMEFFISNIFYSNVHEDRMSFKSLDDSICTDEFIDEQLDYFEKFILIAINSMSAQIKESAIQNMLRMTFTPFTPENAKEYIEKSLTSIKDESLKETIIFRLYEFFDLQGVKFDKSNKIVNSN